MKIALFADTWLPNTNGVVYSIINEVRALEEHEFTLFVPKEHDDVYMDGHPDIRAIEFPSIAFPGYPGYNIGLPSGRFRKTISKERFDLIHSHTPFSMWIMAKILARVQNLPFIQTFHTWLSEYAGHFFRGFAEAQVRWFGQSLSWWVTRRAHNGADASITPSNVLKVELKQHGVVEPIYSIPSAISPVFFKRQFSNLQRDEVRIQFRNRFNLPADSTILMYVGRVSFEKRLEILLETIKRLIRINKKLYLVIVGDGPQLQSYRDLAKKIGVTENTLFTGFIHHYSLPRVYSAADYFLAPSDTETQGLTIIEAMSQKIPVISVKAGGVQDYLIHGKNGLLIPPRSVDSFEQTLLTLFNDLDLRDKLVSEGYKTSLDYTTSGFGKRLNFVFEKAIEVHQKKKG